MAAKWKQHMICESVGDKINLQKTKDDYICIFKEEATSTSLHTNDLKPSIWISFATKIKNKFNLKIFV